MNANVQALRLEVFNKTLQARILKALERKQRLKEKEAGANGVSAAADRLSYHRRVRLAKESRAAHLMLAFYKGRDYDQVEATLSPHKEKAEKLVTRYYPDLSRNIQFLEWVDGDKYLIYAN